MKTKPVLFEMLVGRPRLEVLVRLAWGSLPLSIRRRLLNGKKPRRVALLPELVATGTIPTVEALLDRFAIAPGETFLLHSSGRAVQLLCGSVETLADALAKRCDAGGLTGLIPNYPNLTKVKSSPAENYVWDVASAPHSTGALGEAVSCRPGVGRSALPYNTLTVLGPEAAALDRLEDPDKALYPCGPGTIWATLWERNARIVILGVDIASCLTALHLPEDHDPETWDRLCWYDARRVEIIDGNTRRVSHMRVRREAAARFYAERTFDRDLRQEVFEDRSVHGVPLYIGRACDVTDYLALRRRTQPSYPYFLTPLLRYV